MKLPGSKRKKEAAGRPLVYQDHRYREGNSTAYSDGARYNGSSTGGWEQEEPKNKGSLIKKLNCGARRNTDEDMMGVCPPASARNHYFQQQYGPPSSHSHRPHRQTTNFVAPPVPQRHYHQPPQPRKYQDKQRTSPSKTAPIEDYRPVLITVKDGDSKHIRTHEKPRQEFESMFLVNGPNSSPAVTPMKPRRVTPEKNHKSPERKPKNCIASPLRKKSPGRRAKDMDDVKTEREIARKNRWRRGVQRGWKDDADLGSLSEFGEESTFASTYGDDSYTESYSSESSNESSYESAFRGYKNPARGSSRNSSRKGKKSSRKESKDVSVFDSVAEDLGIVARMILSDGTACFSSAAEITRETIVSCKQDYRR